MRLTLAFGHFPSAHGATRFVELPQNKNSRLALCNKTADLRFDDSRNLPNANHSDLPLLCQPAVKDAQRRNGINGGDPHSREQAVYAGFACRIRLSLTAG